MSAFSAVDDAAEPLRLIQFLDASAVGLAAMKHYMAVTHALRRPTAPVLDLGCGAGHDLTVLNALGVASIGVDPSTIMLDAAAAAARRRCCVLGDSSCHSPTRPSLGAGLSAS